MVHTKLVVVVVVRMRSLALTRGAGPKWLRRARTSQLGLDSSSPNHLSPSCISHNHSNTTNQLAIMFSNAFRQAARYVGGGVGGRKGDMESGPCGSPGSGEGGRGESQMKRGGGAT